MVRVQEGMVPHCMDKDKLGLGYRLLRKTPGLPVPIPCGVVGSRMQEEGRRGPGASGPPEWRVMCKGGGQASGHRWQPLAGGGLFQCCSIWL
jgi:hypothetical protein